MPRKFKTADYATTLKLTVRLEDAVPLNHLARFIVDMIAQLDLSAIYARYGARGGEAIAPEVLLGVLFYGYATGVFSSRKLDKATYESLPLRFVAGDLHPDHDTLATFRKTFLPELKELFVQILWLAQAAGVLKLEFGRDEDPCRCLQEQGRQLQTLVGTGTPTANRSRRAVCVE